MENETKKNTEMIRKRDERRSWEDVRKTNRQYKSSLFQYLFTRKKEDALWNIRAMLMKITKIAK